MNQTIDWINTIIQELVDPTKRLTDTLLKVQVLAFKIKNSKLKIWVESELNGYQSTAEVPSYRYVPTTVVGNLEQERFGGLLSRKHQRLPVEYLDKDIYESLKEAKIQNSVSELELMQKGEGTYQIPIPHTIFALFNKVFSNEWVVTSAWREIGHNSIEGILSSVKSKLLTFLLELAEEVGEKDNIEIIESKKIDTLFDKTFGNISGETVNIFTGSDNIQSVNTGDKAVLNITKGKKVKQKITNEVQQDLSQYISDLKSQISSLSLEVDDQRDVINELTRIESQLKREKPKVSIINEALNVIKGILISVTGNALTPTILEKTQWFLSQFS
jgi:hypothetical protein